MKKTELVEIIKDLTEGRSFVRVETRIWHNARTTNGRSGENGD